MALVAQMVERKTLNLVVVGSSPTEGAFFFPLVFSLSIVIGNAHPVKCVSLDGRVV